MTQHSHSRSTPHVISIKNPLMAHFLSNMHDTELWASHIPRIPAVLYLLAVIGIALGILPFSGLLAMTPAWKVFLPFLGLVMVIPLLFARHFAIGKWNYASNIRKDIFDTLSLRGDESLLDVGCGGGLLVNEAAKRLPKGKALGIDIWAPHSGGGNYDLLMKNAEAEGVADQIEFKQADVRKLPFGDASFDIIVSSGALHHIGRERAEHEQAIREMLRVLKPNGRIVLMDIVHMIESYADAMKPQGVTSEVRSTPPSPFGFEMSIMFGKKQ